MRRYININQNWRFQLPGREAENIHIPHTWNNLDGQDGGNDYLRTAAIYEKTFPKPFFEAGEETVFLDFAGVNSQAEVTLNGHLLCCHEGGYSTFRVELTPYLLEENHLSVRVENDKNNRVYPQKADFTFYGGIYRDVNLIIVNKHHFDLSYYGGPGIRVTAKPVHDYRDADVQVDTWHNAEQGQVSVKLLDAMVFTQSVNLQFLNKCLFRLF